MARPVALTGAAGGTPDVRTVAEPFPSQSFLGGLDSPDVRAIEAIGVSRQWPAGVFLFREGERPESVFFLLDGVVKLVKTALSGNEVVVELRRGGDVVGELGALDRQPRSASVATITPTSAIVVRSDRFNHLLMGNASITHRVLMIVVARLRVSSERQLEMGTLDVIGRVSRRIVELALEAPADESGVVVVRNVSQSDLAAWAGVSRDGVVRALHELREQGWVRTGRQRIDILDLYALSRRAGA